MKRAPLIQPVVQKLSPFEAARDWLLSLRERGYISAKDYRDDLAAIERAQANVEAR